jgi:hypothetical protein
MWVNALDAERGRAVNVLRNPRAEREEGLDLGPDDGPAAGDNKLADCLDRDSTPSLNR